MERGERAATPLKAVYPHFCTAFFKECRGCSGAQPVGPASPIHTNGSCVSCQVGPWEIFSYFPFLGLRGGVYIYI